MPSKKRFQKAGKKLPNKLSTKTIPAVVCPVNLCVFFVVSTLPYGVFAVFAVCKGYLCLYVRIRYNLFEFSTTSRNGKGGALQRQARREKNLWQELSFGFVQSSLQDKVPDVLVHGLLIRITLFVEFVR